MDLSTNYLGLTLVNPLVVGASPFCDSHHVARRLQDAGAAAVVMRSLFEEQIDGPEPAVGRLGVALGAETDYFPEFGEYRLLPGEYLWQVERLKRAVKIPVIASLNGHHAGRWTKFCAQLESAGADAIEVNFYQVVTNPSLAADEVETKMLETIGAMAANVRIPIAVKLSPYHASVAQLAVALELAGAAGVVIFNRFYQPDVDVEELEIQSQLRLSDPSELLLRLRWLAILAPQLRGSLAATGGVHSAQDVIKALLTGAHVVQLVSALYQHGTTVLTTILADLEAWMSRHGYRSIEEFRGRLDLRRCGDPAAFERANYIRALQQFRA